MKMMHSGFSRSSRRSSRLHHKGGLQIQNRRGMKKGRLPLCLLQEPLKKGRLPLYPIGDPEITVQAIGSHAWLGWYLINLCGSLPSLQPNLRSLLRTVRTTL